jgi:NADH dehydrogenase (ubiquinone) Fe-S protein 1
LLSAAPQLRRPDRAALLKAIHGLAEAAGVVKEGWNGYNVIHDNASRVAALDIGFLPSANARKHSGPVKMVYLLGADDFSEADVPKDAFVVYQGHHGDKGAARADVVLPGAAYTEKAGTYVNFEGRVQVRAGGAGGGAAAWEWLGNGSSVYSDVVGAVIGAGVQSPLLHSPAGASCIPSLQIALRMQP